MLQSPQRTVWQFLVKLSKYLPFKLVIPPLDSYPNEMNVFVHLHQNAIQKCLKGFNHNLSKTGGNQNVTQLENGSRNRDTYTQWSTTEQQKQKQCISASSMLLAHEITWMKLKCIVIMKGARFETYNKHIYILFYIQDLCGRYICF